MFLPAVTIVTLLRAFSGQNRPFLRPNGHFEAKPARLDSRTRFLLRTTVKRRQLPAVDKGVTPMQKRMDNPFPQVQGMFHEI
jgi:hypothetical protein